MSRFGFSSSKRMSAGQEPASYVQKDCQPISRLQKRSSWSYSEGSRSSESGSRSKNRSSGSDTAYWSMTEDAHHLSLQKRSSERKLRAPTQSITNGDRTDNSDESGSTRGGHSSSRERSRSRDGSRERERREQGHDPTYGVVRTQPRSSKGKHGIPRRHTVGGSALATGNIKVETERSKDAFMDMLASRYPQYAEKISSTASEDGFPVRGRSRDPRRRATVAYNPLYNRSLDYEGTMSEVDGPTFSRGAFVRSSLPPSSARSPPSTLDKPPGLVFLIFRDETKKALLPNEITHLDTVRAMFVRSFPGKLTMSYLESPKRKIYILDPRTNIYYQLEDLRNSIHYESFVMRTVQMCLGDHLVMSILESTVVPWLVSTDILVFRDIKDRTVLRVHECDSQEQQRVQQKPEVRGRTVHLPPGGAQGYYGSSPSSAITSQVQKAQTLPQHMQQPIYMSYDNVTQSPVRTSYERSRSLTPDPSRSANYAQNPIYGRMGISPERPPPQDNRTGPPDRPPFLRPIPEHYQMINGNKNGARLVYGYVNGQQYQHQPDHGSPSPSPNQRSYPRQAMSPPAVPTGPRVEPGRRAFSPPPNLQNYDYIQVVTGSQAPQGAPPYTGYVAKSVRANTVVTPQRTSVTPSPGQQQASVPAQTSWRERSPVGGHSMPLSAAPYSVPSSGKQQQQQQRSQSYRVPPTQERDSLLMARPRSMTPSPIENEMTRDRIDKMEHQLASLAAWVQSAVVQSSNRTGGPSSVQSASTTASVTSETSPLLESASCKVESEPTGFGEVKGLSDLASDATATLSQDMKDKIIAIKHQADALRLDLRNLRRLQQINKESMIETVDNAWRKIKEAIATVPGAESLLIRQQRNELDVMYQIYLEDKAKAEKELLDLEHAVEELRSDVLSRQCRVQMSDVEGMALVLSHVTKALGELKARFPKLMDTMKHLMSAEMEVIVNEEKFLKDEPEKLDNSLKKCKKLTGTLFTLKRLASVQEHRPPQPIAMTAQAKIPTSEDKKAVLENIQAMIPDHKARVHGIQAAEASRERKKKITSQQEALRFGKSLELASKALKPSGTPGAAPTNVPSRGKSSLSAQSSTTECVPTTSTPKASSSSSDDTSSIISFAMPMSTSTPKSANQPHPTSHGGESSSTSPSLSYPVMSLMRTVQGSEQKDKYHRYDKGDEQREKSQRYDKASAGRTTKSVEFKSQPAILPVTSSEAAGSKTGQGQREDQVVIATSAESPSLTEQKLAARAAFFSSLSSPVTPTTSTGPLVKTSLPSTDSPTEIYSKRSPGVTASPVRGIPSLVRSTAVTVPPTLISTSVTHTSIPKPSSLPMSGHSASSSSLVSTQRFSPASPSQGGGHSVSKPRSSFTAIPKPSSPTKSSTPSPLTPESPKYRVPPSQLSHESVKKMYAGSGAKPKKVPPPPPPRKSSKLPETAVLAVNAATINGQLTRSSDKQLKAEDAKFKENRKSLSDVIDPPKQFANLDTKVERKSSIGSLKQFTTPLLESKRDLQQTKPKQSPLASKKISSSNLDSETSSSKRHSKELNICQDEKSIDETVTEGKLTNLCSGTWDRGSREGSIDSSGSSASGDSQHDSWHKRLAECSETPITDTITAESEDGQGQTKPITTEREQSQKEQTRPSDGKKPKPPPPQRRSSLSSKPQTEESSSQDVEDNKTGAQAQSKVVDRLV